MSQEEKFIQENKEIDLMDYIKVIIKRKWLIFIFFLVGIILVSVFNRSTPKVYKINTFLEIGKIKNENIENADVIISKIREDIYGKIVREKLNISETQYAGIKAENIKNTNFIKLEIDSSNPELAQDILEEMNILILEDYQGVFKNQKENLEKDIEILENNIKILKNDIERTKTKIELLEGEKKNLEDQEKALEAMEPWQKIDQQLSGSLFALLDVREKLSQKKQEINNLYLQINSLEDDINSLQNQVNSLKEQIESIKPTQVIKNPDILEGLIKPKSVFNVVIAGILGVFVGTFLAFLKEWWDKNKNRI